MFLSSQLYFGRTWIRNKDHLELKGVIKFVKATTLVRLCSFIVKASADRCLRWSRQEGLLNRYTHTRDSLIHTLLRNFVKLCSYEGYIVKICISTGNFDSILFQGILNFLNLEIWPKWRILLKQFVSATPLKLLNRDSWNFVINKDILCRCAYLQNSDLIFYGGIFKLMEALLKFGQKMEKG